MAGIVGIAKSNQDKRIEEALGKIAHRGDIGRYLKSHDTATFGQVWPRAEAHYTLGIKRNKIILDGEVFNWFDLGVGNTCALEALYNCYSAEGPEFVKRLDGRFALAIAGKKGLFLARDLLGRAPLYYGKYEGRLCFASEMKALLGWAEEIAEFPAGHYYEPGTGLVQYAKLEKKPQLDLPAEELATELRDRLVNSIRKRTSRGQVGAWLSGGLDSATMTALASRQMPNLKTFAAGVEGAPDLKFARAVAKHVGSEHHEMICTVDEMVTALPEVIYHLESFDALLVRSSVTNYLVGKLASEHVPAVLSGEGGDELFAGYSYLKDLAAEELPDELIDITGRLHNTALQRVDRCSSSHSLVARTGFLDKDVIDYAMRIPPRYKIYHEERPVEKWVLRQAMDGLLPEEVVNRPKAKFWEGAGVTDLLETHASEAISDEEFAGEREMKSGKRLNTKEELFYYRIFKGHFGDADPGIVGRTKGAPVE